MKLPKSVEALHEACEVIERASQVPTWDFVWQGLLDEGREQSMLAHPFLSDVEDVPTVYDSSSDAIHVAESAIKVCPLHLWFSPMAHFCRRWY